MLENVIVTTKLLEETPTLVRYLYEGNFMEDEDKAGIIEFEKELFYMNQEAYASNPMMYAINAFLTRKLRILRVCRYRKLSKDKVDQIAILACFNIVMKYFEKNKIPSNTLYMGPKMMAKMQENPDFVEFLKKEGALHDHHESN